MKKTHLLLASLSTGFLSLSLQAQEILSDDFESYTAGDNISGETNWNADNRAGAPTTQDGNFFGASNQYAEINDGSTGGFSSIVHTTNIAAGQVVTFSLDFIAANDQDLNFGFAPSASANTVLGGSDSIMRATLANGSITGWNETNGFGSGFFSLNTAYELKMVLNDSAATVNYADRSLTANSYDVWIRDLTVTGSTYVGTGTFASDAGGYYSAARSFNSPTPNYLIDNWLVEQGAVVSPIPEPATTALLLGSLGLLVLRRRRA